jgi:hypothetical protein
VIEPVVEGENAQEYMDDMSSNAVIKPVVEETSVAGLERALTQLLSGDSTGVTAVTILDRQEVLYKSTFPVERIRCRVNEGEVLDLLCKYEKNPTDSHVNYGHRGGVRYEALAYQSILQSLDLSLPTFYGFYDGSDVPMPFMAIEYIDNGCPVSLVAEIEQAMANAAAWIGRFHAINESNATSPATQFLVRYTPEFYLGWIRRTIEFLALLDIREPWLMHLCEQAVPLLATLAEQTPTVIHGEYYPMNILVRDSEIVPIDWESTAIAAGEIDLACLTDDWPDDVVQLCQESYAHARWTLNQPENHLQRLDAARLYLHFRWLGDRVGWTRARLNRLSELRATGERLGWC